MTGLTLSGGFSGKSGQADSAAVRVRARAKINLALDVLGRRPDGYHELRMIMQTISLCDTLTIGKTAGETGKKPEERPVELTCASGRAGQRFYIPTNASHETACPPLPPTGEGNIAFRAAAHMHREYGLKSGISIHLEKAIPLDAGLAGGSADCAGTILGINALFGLGLGEAKMLEIAGRFGSDVPFCVIGGTALCEGAGERLTRLTGLTRTPVVVVKPAVGMSTAAVFAKYDEICSHPKARPSGEPAFRPDIDAMIRNIRSGDVKAVAAGLGNVLEAVSSAECPEIPAIKEILLSSGAMGAAMSGSGSSVFGIFEDEAGARGAAEAVRAKTAGVEYVFVTEMCEGNEVEQCAVAYSRRNAL